MRSTFKILTYINRNKIKADGTTAVLCRITIDGKSTAMTTGIYVAPDNWNADKGEIIGSVKDNNRLKELRKRLETTYDTLLKEHGVVSAELLKNTVTGSVTLPKMLLEAGEQELIRQEEHCKAVGSMSSYRDCRNVQKRLREYVESRGLSDIAFTDITEEFGESYKTYLKTAFNYHRSYINRSLTWLNRLLYTAVDRDIIRANPLTEVRYEKKEHAPVRYLTREQLKLMMKTPFDDERMELARRMFIFTSFSGLAFADIYRLYPHQICTTADGQRYIRKNREKTDVESFVPLHPVAEKILSLYNTIDDTKPVFPLLSRDSMWYHYNSMGKALGFERNLTHHQARHTFCVQMISEGICLESIAKMMGHSCLTTTQTYARITDQTISKEMDKLMKRREERGLSKIASKTNNTSKTE